MKPVYSILIVLFLTVFSVFNSFAQIGERFELTSTTTGPKDLKTADMDGDGDRDVVFISSAKLGWFENNDSGTWPQHIIGREFYGSADIVIADFNQDGHEDVAVGENYDNLALFTSDGTGNFTYSLVSDMLDIVNDLRVFDVDEDGDLDIISASFYNGFLGFHENLGQNEFAPLQVVEEGSTLSGHRDLRIGDIDNDGLSDMVLRVSENDPIQWMKNLGSGDFGEPSAIGDFGIGGAGVLTDIELADLDSDGDLDLVIGSVISNIIEYPQLSWAENLGEGEFGPLNGISSQFIRVLDLDIADVNNDGHLDIVVAADPDEYELGHVLYYTNDGLGNFSALNTIPFLGVPVTLQAEYVHLDDIDNDGQIEFLASYNDRDMIYLFDNIQSPEDFEFRRLNVRLTNLPDLQVVDINQDGLMDVLSSSNSTADNYIYWFEQLENGAFEPGVAITDTMNASTWYPTDLDQDGDIDFIVMGWAGGAINWHENLGNGTWANIPNGPPPNYISYLPSSSHRYTIADLDNDGLDDIFTFETNYSNGGDNIAWAKNLGNVEFGPFENIIDDSGWGFLHKLVDMNGDGHIDFLYYHSTTGPFSWYENDGSGNFDVIHDITDPGFILEELYASDINEDGMMDVVVWSEDGPLYVSYAQVDNTFSSYEMLLDLTGFGAVELHDFNGDGRDELTYRFIDNMIVSYATAPGTFATGETLFEEADETTWTYYFGDIDDDNDEEVFYHTGYFYSRSLHVRENQYGEGCIDPAACNYDPNDFIDDGSCCYECGCTILGADNYNENACLEDGSCEFLVHGIVFFDENENGVMDSTEYGIAQHEVNFTTNNIEIITNDNGNFLATAAGSDEYTFGIMASDQFPFITTPNNLTFDASEDNWNEEIFFGLSTEAPNFDVDVHLYSSGMAYPCDVVRRHDICFSNMSNQPIDVSFELVYDELFQGIEEVSEIDSIVGNMVYFSEEQVNPGQTVCLEVGLHTPTVDFIGSDLETSLTINGFYQGDLVVQDSTSISVELTCAYDPNDKQVFPEGYTEEHYIHPNGTLEYLVRFQNTGNAPATDVIIRDTIDLDLDINSFELLTNSHPVFTTVHFTERVIEFYFQDIMLPDSVNNEPESHGLVSYSIRPNDDVPLLNEINNTAYIFFDNNPPILTNTTWSTIYNCSLFEVEINNNGTILSASQGTQYQWFFEAVLIDGATEQEYEATENGSYSVEVSNGFPCTVMSSSILVAVSGCLDASACNYNPEVVVDDGSCLFIGQTCDDDDPNTIDDVITDVCICQGTALVFGCLNEEACNYEANADVDDGSCFMIGDPCDDNNPSTGEDVINEECICEGLPFLYGCMDENACNFSATANFEDGSCLYTGAACDDNDPATFDDVINENCICAGILVGIQDVYGSARELIIYPNPAHSELSLIFHLYEAGPISFEIYDVLGIRMKNRISTFNSGEVNHTINILDLPTGIYVLRISNGENATNQEFSIVR